MSTSDSAAVNPAVPIAIASSALRPVGQRHDPVAGHAHELRVAAVVRDAEVVAGDEHRDRPSRNRESALEATVPATSMPPISGKRRMILPAPVAASASL